MFGEDRSDRASYHSGEVDAFLQGVLIIDFSHPGGPGSEHQVGRDRVDVVDQPDGANVRVVPHALQQVGGGHDGI